MGRYFLYRMHPWSVAELLRPTAPDAVVQSPRRLPDPDWRALLDHGGFPEPFLKREPRFTRRWRALRQTQLTREDLREVAQIQALGALETLTHVLAERSGAQFGVRLQSRTRVDVERRHGPAVGRPARASPPRLPGAALVQECGQSLRKEPKWYLPDWAGIDDAGSRAETMVACHLLKAVEAWTDIGLGDFELRYLRDKLKREVDFVRHSRPEALVSRRGEGLRYSAVAVTRVFPGTDARRPRAAGRTESSVRACRLFRRHGAGCRARTDVPEPVGVVGDSMVRRPRHQT